MERTTKLERVLFRAVRILMLVAALLALLVGIGMGLSGLVKSGASANETISAPVVSFEQYSKQVAEEAARENAEKAAQAKAAEEAKNPSAKKPVQKAEPEEFPDRYRDVLNDIEKSIVSYARKTEQPAPTDKLRKNIYREADKVFASYRLTEDFLRKLAQLSKSLDASGDELGKLDDSDPRKIFWGKFLDYVYAQYEGNLTRQVNAIRTAMREAEVTRSLANGEYMKAGVCVGAFFVLTLLLVLLHIEKNTYTASQTLRSASPGTDDDSVTFDPAKKHPAFPDQSKVAGTRPKGES